MLKRSHNLVDESTLATIEMTKKTKTKIYKALVNMTENPDTTMPEQIKAWLDAINRQGNMGKILYEPLGSWEANLNSGTLAEAKLAIQNVLIPKIASPREMQLLIDGLKEIQETPGSDINGLQDIIDDAKIHLWSLKQPQEMSNTKIDGKFIIFNQNNKKKDDVTLTDIARTGLAAHGKGMNR